MSELNTSAGGIHPGKPIIWPTLKSTPTSQQTTTETTEAQTAQTTQTSATSQTTATAATPVATTPAAATTTASTVARPLTINDLQVHLSSMQIPNTETNIKLASMMLKFGVELSRENFIKALGLMEGTDKALNTQEAALVLMSKGVDNSPEAIKMLSTQLAENPSLLGQMASTKNALSNMTSSMSLAPQTFSPTMVANLSGLVAEFSGMLDSLPKKYKFGSDSSNSIDRNSLVNDVRAIKSLIDGIQEKASAGKGAGTIGDEAQTNGLIDSVKKLGDLFNKVAQENPEAIKSDPSLTKQIQTIKAAISELLATLTDPKNFTIKTMEALSSLMENFLNVSDKITQSNNAVGRDVLITNANSLKSLLDGIQEKAVLNQSAVTPESEAAKSALMAASSKVGDLLENLLSQVLLSQRSAKDPLSKQDYLYYQIPNVLLTPPSNIDIIIKRDPGKDKAVDLSNTQIVMGLETEALGKMVVSLIIRNKELTVFFNTEREDIKKMCMDESASIKKSLASKGYDVKDFQARVNKSMCSIKPYLMPLMGLDHVFRIDSVT